MMQEHVLEHVFIMIIINNINEAVKILLDQKPLVIFQTIVNGDLELWVIDLYCLIQEIKMQKR